MGVCVNFGWKKKYFDEETFWSQNKKDKKANPSHFLIVMLMEAIKFASIEFLPSIVMLTTR